MLYRMRNALRVDENPALDVAILVSEQLQVHSLIYQGLSENYRFASDGHRSFILQGAADVAAECDAKGLSYACFVSRESNRSGFFS